jgi:hypothetical protein
LAAAYNVFWRGPGEVIKRDAETRHKLILQVSMPAKTIFVMFKKSNSWGFYTETGKIGYREYLGLGE